MGLSMSRRLKERGHDVYGYAPSAQARSRAKRYGVKTAASLAELVGALPKGRRILWMMVPNGPVVARVFRELLPLLRKGDIVVQGGNDFYREVQALEKRGARKGVFVLDCGTSGGVHGYANGYNLMIGGKKQAYRYAEPLFKDLAAKGGYGHFGPSGAGHFVKSVHNVVEYGYLQAIGEGLQMISESPVGSIDMKHVAAVWRNHSVISSWLMDLADVALSRRDFRAIKPIITSQTTMELIQTVRDVKTPTPAFDASVRARKDSRRRTAMARRVINAIRREFGGHRIVK